MIATNYSLKNYWFGTWVSILSLQCSNCIKCKARYFKSISKSALWFGECFLRCDTTPPFKITDCRWSNYFHKVVLIFWIFDYISIHIGFRLFASNKSKRIIDAILLSTSQSSTFESVYLTGYVISNLFLIISQFVDVDI